MFVEEVPAQSAEFVGAKPGFGFEPERVKRAVVAGEDGRCIETVDVWPS
jgi:hypothetical protein